MRVLTTLRQFLRECTPWRSLQATQKKASGSTLRRCLDARARTGVLAQVHAMLVAMLRGDPDLILDSCSVPVTCLATAANVSDTLVFERLFLAAFAGAHPHRVRGQRA